MPKTQDKNSSVTKDGKVASQASANSCGATGHPGTSITSGDLFDAIKELKSELKRDNDNLRKDINSFHTEVSGKLDGLAEEMQGMKERVGEMETRVGQVEDLALEMTEALTTAIKYQKTLQRKLTDLESRSRRNNIRIFGVAEGEEGSSVMRFVSDLLKRELPLPTDMDLKIQRAHRSLAPKPRPEAPPRPLIINFHEFTTKETVLREAWKKGKIQLGNRPLFFDHDYAAEIVQKRREYNEIKKCLKAKGIRFQTPYTNMRIHWDSGVRTYTSAHDAGRELQRRGYSVEMPAAMDEEDSGVTRLKELLGWQRKGRNPQGMTPTATERVKERLREFQRSPTE